MFPKLGLLHVQLALLSTSTRNLNAGTTLSLGLTQVRGSFDFSALIWTLCSPNSNSRLDWKLDTSCQPFSLSEASRPRPPWSLPLARHLVSPHHSNCSASLNFQVQAPRHLSPMLVADSTSFPRLGLDSSAETARLSSLVLCTLFLPLAPVEPLLSCCCTELLRLSSQLALQPPILHLLLQQSLVLASSENSFPRTSSFCLHGLPQLLP